MEKVLQPTTHYPKREYPPLTSRGVYSVLAPSRYVKLLVLSTVQTGAGLGDLGQSLVAMNSQTHAFLADD